MWLLPWNLKSFKNGGQNQAKSKTNEGPELVQVRLQDWIHCFSFAFSAFTSELQVHFEFVVSFIGLWRRHAICRSTLLSLEFVQWWIFNTQIRKPPLLPSSCANLFGVPFRKTDSQSLGLVTSAMSFFNSFVTSGTYMSHLQSVFSSPLWTQYPTFFSMLSSTLKYLYSVEPVRINFAAKQPYTNDTVCNAAM
jgi:hypothetical protein